MPEINAFWLLKLLHTQISRDKTFDTEKRIKNKLSNILCWLSAPIAEISPGCFYIGTIGTSTTTTSSIYTTVIANKDVNGIAFSSGYDMRWK